MSNELELQNTLLKEQVEQLKIELQESIDAANQLLTDKMQSAASIIKSQKLEFSQLLTQLEEKDNLIQKYQKELVPLEKDLFESLIEMAPDITIPKEWEVNSLHVVENLMQKYTSSRNQVEEQIHFLKVSSDGFNYELQVLEKENHALSKDNERLSEENLKLQETLTQVKSVAGEKLKIELAEKEQLLLQIQDLNDKVTFNLEKISNLETNLKEKGQDTQFLEELQDSNKLNDKLKKDIERLQGHLLEVESNHHQDIIGLETTVSSLKEEISEASREQKTWQEAVQAEKLEKKEIQESLNQLNLQVSKLTNENEKLKAKAKDDLQCINNLQMVLNEFESARDSEIKFSLSQTLDKLDSALAQNQKLESRVLEAESKLSKYESESTDSSQLLSLVSTKESEIQKLKHDIANLQSHLSEAMRRLKTSLNSDIVDKKLVSNLFVQFLSLPRGDSKKFEILDVISGILDLSKSDKVRVGLLNDNLDSPKESSTFTDMWISFLYKEAGILDDR